MRAPDRDDVVDAGLASLAAGVHLAMAAVVGRFPPEPELDVELLYVGLPVLLAAAAAGTLLLHGDRRPLQAACVYTWLAVLFTLPAFFLGLAWVPSAAVLTLALVRPRISSVRPAAG